MNFCFHLFKIYLGFEENLCFYTIFAIKENFPCILDFCKNLLYLIINCYLDCSQIFSRYWKLTFLLLFNLIFVDFKRLNYIIIEICYFFLMLLQLLKEIINLFVFSFNVWDKPINFLQRLIKRGFYEWNLRRL